MCKAHTDSTLRTRVLLCQGLWVHLVHSSTLSIYHLTSSTVNAPVWGLYSGGSKVSWPAYLTVSTVDTIGWHGILTLRCHANLRYNRNGLPLVGMASSYWPCQPMIYPTVLLATLVVLVVRSTSSSYFLLPVDLPPPHPFRGWPILCTGETRLSPLYRREAGLSCTGDWSVSCTEEYASS